MDIENVDYTTKIPNNVNLAEDRQVLRALESWHPGYLDWWKDMGPDGFQESLVYLRTAVSVDPKGWAKFDYVRMPEYRWGILLAPQERTARSRSAAITASRPGRMCRASIAPCCAGSSSSRATPSRPRSSSSAISARPRRRSTTCATCSRSMSRKGGICGRWSTSCRNISAATAARKRPACCSAAPAMPTSRACSAPSTRRRRIGCRSSCSPSSPIATARCSSKAWRNPASTRCRAPAGSC